MIKDIRRDIIILELIRLKSLFHVADIDKICQTTVGHELRIEYTTHGNTVQISKLKTYKPIYPRISHFFNPRPTLFGLIECKNVLPTTTPISKSSGSMKIIDIYELQFSSRWQFL